MKSGKSLTMPALAAPDTDPRRLWLTSQGFKVGARDPRINTDHPGAFMVAEEHAASELPTRDGSDGPWAIVGDDLPALVAEAYEVWAHEYGKEP